MGEEQQRLFGGSSEPPLLQGSELGFEVDSLTGVEPPCCVQCLAEAETMQAAQQTLKLTRALFPPLHCRSMGDGGERPFVDQLAAAGRVPADRLTRRPVKQPQHGQCCLQLQAAASARRNALYAAAWGACCN